MAEVDERGTNSLLGYVCDLSGPFPRLGSTCRASNLPYPCRAYVPVSDPSLSLPISNSTILCSVSRSAMQKPVVH
jgi:hypothetical protein